MHSNPEVEPIPYALSLTVRISGILLFVFSILVVLVRFVQFYLFKDPPLEDLVQAQGFIPMLGIPSLLSALFFLIGLGGLFLKQLRHIDVMGAVVFLFAFVGVALSYGAIWSYALATPGIAALAPELLVDPSSVLVMATLISFMLGQVGWLLVGVWSFLKGSIPRWSSMTLIFSILGAMALSPFAETQTVRLLFNMLLGIGPAVIGYVLWRYPDPGEG